jgi:hypothetical protein
VKQLWPFLIVTLWFVCAPAPVSAGQYFLELSEHTDRAAADKALIGFGPDGENMRVSRRYVREQGWLYVVRLDGFEDKGSAVAAAHSFAEDGQVVRVIEGLGYKRVTVEEVGAKWTAAPASPVAEVKATSEFPSASQVLRLAAKAHGGKAGGSRMLQEVSGVRFSFDSRTVVGDKEWKVKHTFLRSGDQARLEVDVLKGDGVSNTVVLAAPDKAWIATHDMVRERDGVQAAEMMTRFAPETGLLSIPLGFAGDIREASEWRGLSSSGRVSHQGRPHLRVVPGRDEDGEQNPMEAALFDEETHRLAQVTWITRGGRVTFQFGEYKPIAESLVIPHRVRVERNGQLVEEIEVQEFELNPSIETSLFGEPTVLRGRKH